MQDSGSLEQEKIAHWQRGLAGDSVLARWRGSGSPDDSADLDKWSRQTKAIAGEGANGAIKDGLPIQLVLAVEAFREFSSIAAATLSICLWPQNQLWIAGCFTTARQVFDVWERFETTRNFPTVHSSGRLSWWRDFPEVSSPRTALRTSSATSIRRMVSQSQGLYLSLPNAMSRAIGKSAPSSDRAALGEPYSARGGAGSKDLSRPGNSRISG